MFGSKLDILNQQWIDVVFAKRNKAYGAYELRRDNPRNTNKALIIGVVVFVFLISFKTILNKIQGFIPKADEKVKITEVVLPPPPLDETKKPPPPPPEPPKPKVDQVKFPPLVVKPDNEIREKDPKGDPNADIRIDEPVGNSDVKQVVEENPNQIFTAVEQSPSFPGGDAKFGAYLGKAIRYPAIARENNVQGRVILTFVVERDGSLTDIKVVRGIGSGCDEEAVRALKASPKWKPGIQNGRPVRVQYSVPVAFSLSQE
jgi:protein TonB